MKEVLHYIGIIQAFIVGIVLLSIRRDGRFKFLGFLLIYLCFGIAGETYVDHYEIEFHFLYPFEFFFLLPNLVYLHVCSTMEQNITSKKL